MVCSAMNASFHAGSSPGHQPRPAAGQPVATLHRLREVAAPGLGGLAHARRRTPSTANSATSGQPSPPSGRADSCHSSSGPTSESPECIAAHRAAPLKTSRAASSSTHFCGPRVCQHGGGVVCSRERERVRGGGHRGTNSAIDHRQSGLRNPLLHRDPETFSEISGPVVGVGSAPSLRRFRDGRCATSSTSGGRPRRQDRSQPAGGNPIASPPLTLG